MSVQYNADTAISLQLISIKFSTTRHAATLSVLLAIKIPQKCQITSKQAKNQHFLLKSCLGAHLGDSGRTLGAFSMKTSGPTAAHHCQCRMISALEVANRFVELVHRHDEHRQHRRHRIVDGVVRAAAVVVL